MRLPITGDQIKDLAAQLDPSTKLYTRADGQEYEKLIARWADNAIRQAVSSPFLNINEQWLIAIGRCRCPCGIRRSIQASEIRLR